MWGPQGVKPIRETRDTNEEEENLWGRRPGCGAASGIRSIFGTDDGLITTHGAMKSLLKAKGVKFTLMEVPGYGHEWKFWRLSLRDLVPRLFQQSK